MHLFCISCLKMTTLIANSSIHLFSMLHVFSLLFQQNHVYIKILQKIWNILANFWETLSKYYENFT